MYAFSSLFEILGSEKKAMRLKQTRDALCVVSVAGQMLQLQLELAANKHRLEQHITCDNTRQQQKQQQ